MLSVADSTASGEGVGGCLGPSLGWGGWGAGANDDKRSPFASLLPVASEGKFREVGRAGAWAGVGEKAENCT